MMTVLVRETEIALLRGDNALHAWPLYCSSTEFESDTVIEWSSEPTQGASEQAAAPITRRNEN